MQKNGRFNELQAQSIDIAVHFLCKKTLKAMHEELLRELCSKTSMPGMPPLDQSFESRQAYGAYTQNFEKKCSLQQLSEVLRVYNFFPQELDLKFLSTQYIVAGR